MPNPSEITRADHEAYEYHARVAYDTKYSKQTREINLREARRLADELGLPQPGPINGLSAEALYGVAQDDQLVVLTRNQRLTLIDALLFTETHGEYDREQTEERRVLIEKLRTK